MSRSIAGAVLSTILRAANKETALKRLLLSVLLGITMVALGGCQSAYYGAMEKVGYHKREILVDRVEKTQQAQKDAQQQFRDALERFRAMVEFDGGDLESMYDDLNAQYERSESAASDIRDRIDGIRSVADALFDEWHSELGEYTNQSLRRQSERELAQTKARYDRLMTTMERAEKSMDPVLAALHDNVLFLKHNLNARAIGSLKNQYQSVKVDIDTLIGRMQKSIDESNRFIADMKSR